MREQVPEHNDDDPTAFPSSSSTMPVRTLRANSTSMSLSVLSDPRATSASSPFAPAGKGGCWTCRLRRKKCDEQPENNACHTCRRLRIECLGWGARRPDWMRDKTKVEAYKAGIKKQLSSQGMIRGQPRQPQVITPINVSPMQYQYPEQFTPTAPAPDTGSDENSEEFAYDPRSISAQTSPAYHTIQMPQLTPDLSHGISALDLHLFPTPGIPQVPLPHTFNPRSPQVMGGDIVSFVPSQYYPSNISPTASAPRHVENRDEYVQYYFRTVQQIQFLFSSGPNVESVFRDLVVREPDGVVMTSICALAALHQSQVRVGEGLEDPNAENSCYSMAMNFYREAWWQLESSQQANNSRYTEQDATAAVHLVSFWLLAGGGEWQTPLSVACDWLQGTSLNTMPNPRLQWLQLSLCARFTAQMTMWFDIISAINTNQIPRFMDLYRRLFRTDNNFWPGSPQGAHVQNLHMATLTGCPDGVMYALAEIACLSHWKNQQAQNRCLSIRELVRRANAIEENLRASWVSASPEAFPHLQLMEMHHYDMNRGTSLPGTAPPSLHQSPAFTTTDLGTQSTPVSPVYNAHRLRLISNVFFETTLLYLQCVINGHNPAVPEIMEAVTSIIQALRKLEPLHPSRGLVFPICFAGCLADSREQREYFLQLIDTPPIPIGTRQQTRQLMESVWQRRGTTQCAVEWPSLMTETGSKILII